MAKLIVNLRNVPEDEYFQLLELLDTESFDYYETTVGFWGIGVAGLWLRSDEEWSRLEPLLNEFWTERKKIAEEEWQRRIDEGEEPHSLWVAFKNRPISFILVLGFIALIGTLTLYPFLSIGS